MINQTDKLDLKREEVDVIILSPLIIFFNLDLCHYEAVTLNSVNNLFEHIRLNKKIEHI